MPLKIILLRKLLGFLFSCKAINQLISLMKDWLLMYRHADNIENKLLTIFTEKQNELLFKSMLKHNIIVLFICFVFD